MSKPLKRGTAGGTFHLAQKALCADDRLPVAARFAYTTTVDGGAMTGRAGQNPDPGHVFTPPFSWVCSSEVESGNRPND